MSRPRHSVSINPYSGSGELVVLFSGHGQTAPLHIIDSQVLDYFLVHYVVSGKGIFRCMGHEYHLQAGSSFFIFPGELSSYASDEHDPWYYRWVGFRGSQAEAMLNQINISQHRPIVDTGSRKRLPVLYRHIEQTLRDARPNCDIAAGGYMRLLLAEYAHEREVFHREQRKPLTDAERQVEQAIRWLTLQYSQPVSIDNMAQSLGYHRTYLSKVFKLHTGMSPMNFLLKIRMERAKLLLFENLTIEQVASSVGYADPLYFSKQFKKWHGSSPSDFRLSQVGKERFDCSQ